MLHKLSDEIRECYRHATEARLKADAATHLPTKEDFLDLERRWLFLAHSYEFSERLYALHRRQAARRKQASSHPQLPLCSQEVNRD
jgi:hypothetical protein